MEVYFNENSLTLAPKELWQYDTGQTLTVSGLECLNAQAEFHFEDFANQTTIVKACTYDSENQTVSAEIPNVVLETAPCGTVRVWLYLTDGDNGKTVEEIRIPVKRRAKPENYIRQDDLSKTDALNAAVSAHLREHPIIPDDEIVSSAVTDYMDLHPVNYSDEVIRAVDEIKDDVFTAEVESYNASSPVLALENGYYNLDGTIGAHAVYMHTDRISVIDGTDLSYTNLRSPHSSLPCIVCFIRGVYSRALSYFPGTTDYVSGVFHIPESVTEVALVTRNAVDYPISIEMSVYRSRIDALGNSVDELNDLAESLNTVKTTALTSADLEWESAYISKTGALSEHARYHSSPMIPVVPGSEVIYQNLRAPAKNYPYLAGYTENDRSSYRADCSIIAAGTDYASGSFIVPENVAYISVSIFDLVNPGYIFSLEIQENANRIDELESTVENAGLNPWKGKSWYAFGTSITSVNNTSGAGGTPTGKYAPYLKQISGMRFHDYGIAGGTIGSGGVHGGSSSILNHILSTDLSGADLITIEGFVNDFACSVSLGAPGDTANTTMYGAITQAVIYCLEHSDATVVLITESIGRQYDGADYRSTRKNVLDLTQNDYNDVIRNVGKFLGVPVIDAGGESFINEHRPEFLSDHIHHSELGGQQYAAAIWDRLKSIHRCAKAEQ